MAGLAASPPIVVRREVRRGEVAARFGEMDEVVLLEPGPFEVETTDPAANGRLAASAPSVPSMLEVYQRTDEVRPDAIDEERFWRGWPSALSGSSSPLPAGST